jgi:(S)-2-hydroxy-acid oxidase
MASRTPDSDPITVNQVEAIARQKLPSNVYDYYACGADDQTVIERNRSDFDR